MHSSSEAFGFFHWIGISHYLNLLLVGFMVRSGLEIQVGTSLAVIVVLVGGSIVASLASARHGR